jgi:L-threonylcarbamoyladenylate synthase
MTVVLPATEAGIAQAADWLREGKLVAFGTETVYGLGARADDARAVAAIYTAKGRPSHNPLICHYPDMAAAAADVVAGEAARALGEAFWPGPLTLVLPRRAGSRIAAGVGPADTLAIRVPGHAIALRLLAAVGVPVAAPSANPSGRVSPTTAAHVLEGLEGRIDAVLESGACGVGLESTVIDLSGAAPVLLRPGGVTEARIAGVIGTLASGGGAVLRAPGQMASHYAPLLPLRLEAVECGPDEALLAFGPPVGAPGVVYQLSAGRDLAEAAARLFGGLRWLDQAAASRGLRGIEAMPIPSEGLGAAIMDRLTRAAHRKMLG